MTRTLLTAAALIAAILWAIQTFTPGPGEADCRRITRQIGR